MDIYLSMYASSAIQSVFYSLQALLTQFYAAEHNPEQVFAHFRQGVLSPWRWQKDSSAKAIIHFEASRKHLRALEINERVLKLSCWFCVYSGSHFLEQGLRINRNRDGEGLDQQTNVLRSASVNRDIGKRMITGHFLGRDFCILLTLSV